MNELISVIVPVYNVQNYLQKCLDSILSQRYSNLEILLVDDGSTDHSPEICERYAEKDARIRLIHKQNGGLSSARNAALELCRGDYIAFVDSDDWILPDMLDAMLNACREADADLAVCGIGTEHPPIIKKYPIAEDRKLLDNEALMYAYLSTHEIRQVVWNKLYRARLFDRLRFTEGVINEDVFIMHELLGRCGRAVLVSDCFYIQYIRNDSIMQSKFSEKNLDCLTGTERLISYLEERYPQYESIGKCKQINNYVSLMKRILDSGQYDREREIFSSLYDRLCKDYAEYSVHETEKRYLYKDVFTALRSKKRFILKCRLSHRYLQIRNGAWTAFSKLYMKIKHP